MRKKIEGLEDSSHLSQVEPEKEKGRAREEYGSAGPRTKLLLRVNEAADLLGIEVGTLYHWVSESRVPHIKLSLRCLRFRRDDLVQWVAENSKNAIPFRGGSR